MIVYLSFKKRNYIIIKKNKIKINSCIKLILKFLDIRLLFCICSRVFIQNQTKQQMEEWQIVIIDLFGWLYFLAWSVSFYGQIYVNRRLKSVQGMNLDLVQLNFTGFFFYSAYNTQGYFIDAEQTGQVDFNDVLFSYNALFATIICIYQSFIYERGINKVHCLTKVILAGLWIFVIIYGLLTHYTKVLEVHPDFGVFSLMGYFKLLITMIKYLPQLFWNYVRKSTKGWSIFSVILDFTGGILSFSQMGLEQAFGNNTEWNMVKVLLGISSVIYDTFFILQHFYWFAPINQQQQKLGSKSAIDFQKNQVQMTDDLEQ